ncbi:MAG: hypothetical protein HF967_10490, partial [Methanosarcinales archaeon]|nr:hypothetical protein [Methanosarcinales archaeon]
IYPKNIGTISRYGLFTALKNGTTTVTATSQANPNLTATAEVTIRPAPEYIKIHPFIAHMYVGEIESFTASVYPDGVNQSVIWSCSGNGFISEIYGNKIEFTADSVGSATIRARSKLNSSVYETVRITIRAEEIIIEEEEDEEDDATVPCTDPGVDAPLGVAMGGAVEGGVGADAEKDGKAAEGGGTPIGVAVADAAIDGADARDVAEAADAGKTVAGRVMAVVESIIDKPYRAHKVNLSLSTIFGAMILIGFIAIGYMIISDKHKRKQW